MEKTYRRSRRTREDRTSAKRSGFKRRDDAALDTDPLSDYTEEDGLFDALFEQTVEELDNVADYYYPEGDYAAEE